MGRKAYTEPQCLDTGALYLLMGSIGQNSAYMLQSWTFHFIFTEKNTNITICRERPESWHHRNLQIAWFIVEVQLTTHNLLLQVCWRRGALQPRLNYASTTSSLGLLRDVNFSQILSQSSTAGVLKAWSFTATPKLRLHHFKFRFTTRR